ncbi:4-oxalomesaconate tautomerase [Motiliproteus coralliicola]|uniref:4-oxalomesaconate tautomerase n=1 Tax=Motiliproteus coralliicola TaxID=2283196 RepID=A0A369WK61_9GAMM|nr:4-oxalomesaconate tautomerase [Motiliproteus coralliicola]RDE19845.1 4-oxalomesaconate tautomerase [Motiliproteus coralliicola]
MPIQTAIPCTMMRGGTSRGPYFLANDLPRDPELRDQVLLAVMGSGHAQQIDGIGGGSSLSSKVAVVSVSQHPDADIDYLFAQVSVDEKSVDLSPSCGNILSGVGPFAIESGLVNADDEQTRVRVRNVNTDSMIELVVQTPGGQVDYEGETRIDGVEGSAAPILLNFLDVAGTKTGKLLPTGNLRDSFDGVEVSCVDASVPMVLIPATALGKQGDEAKTELDSDTELLARIERIRQQASWKMGLGDATGKVLPKVALLSKPRNGGTITSRYFVPDNCHAAHAVTGAICVASAAMLPGTITDELIDRPDTLNPEIGIEHPSGKIDLVLELAPGQSCPEIRRAGLIRTARKLFRGELYVPGRIWSRPQARVS